MIELISLVGFVFIMLYLININPLLLVVLSVITLLAMSLKEAVSGKHANKKV